MAAVRAAVSPIFDLFYVKTPGEHGSRHESLGSTIDGTDTALLFLWV